MRTINQDHMMYGSWDIKCKGQGLLSFWAIFLPFDPPNNPKNQNFEKMKQTPGDIIILHMSTINAVWFLRHGAQQTILSHFGPFFALLPLPAPP